MRSRKVTEFKSPQIAVPLSDKDQHARALELAQVCEEIDRIRLDAKDEGGIARKKVRALEKRRRLLAESVRTGHEMQDAQEPLPFDGKKKRAAASGNVDA